MSIKRFIIPALLGLASWLVADNLAQAGHGGGHGGGGHGGGGHGGGGHGGGHMGGGHMGGGHYGGGGFYGGGLGYGGLGGFGLGGYGLGGYGLGGYGLGGYGGGGYGYGGGYGGGGYGYGGGGYGNSYLSSGYGYGSPQYSYYPSNNMMAQPSYIQPSYAPVAPAVPPGAGQVRVLVPDPTAQVLFDGAATQQTGTDRYFHTPALAAGSTYTYRIRASWLQNGTQSTQERVVNVTPGQTSVADFR